MVDIGTFRAVKTEDLIRYRYQGDQERAAQDLRNLTAQGLIEQKTVYDDREPRQSITLTETGSRLIKRHKPEGLPEAVVHHGFVKPRETLHDADLYSLYQRKVEEIEVREGRIRGVFLDSDLKMVMNQDLAKLKDLSEEDQQRRRREIAKAYGLRVVDGKIPVPDLRVQYEIEGRGVFRCDLELATRNYRPGGLAEKARAGFRIYAPARDAPRLRRALRDTGIMTKILSL